MDKKSILTEIKDLLFNNEEAHEIAFADYKVGELVIRVDELATGSQVSVVTEDGVIEAGAELAGEHLLEDGTKIVLDEAGVITEIIEPEVVEDVVEEDLGEKKEDEKMEEEVKVDEVEVKDDELTELKEEIKKMKEQIEKMMEENKKYSNFSSALLEKIEDYVKNTPAEMSFASIKSEYSNVVESKKSTQASNLETIKKLRKK